MKRNRIKLQTNIRWLVVALLVGMGIVVLRYAWIQLVKGTEMTERMRYQVGLDYAIQSPRGAILDRNGRELAISTMTKSLFIDPSHVEDPEAVAEDLAPLVDKTKEEILECIDAGGGFVWVKRRMEHSEYEAVRAMIREKQYSTCLGFRDEAKRYYPNDMLAANVIGFVGTDDKGLDGIEQALDKYIKGEVTESFIYTDRRERPILDSIFARNGYRGDHCKTIELTIDSAIQFIVEQEMDKAMASISPHAITCVVMDPKTGEVLAMASRPTYNPNKYWDYDQEIWKNRAVSSIYEPGSTFKAVVASAALQEKVVSPNEIFVDPGHVYVSGYYIQNWNGESFGTVTFTDVVKNSLNTGFALVGLRLGAEKIIDYAKRFGFGEETGIELPGEEPGLLFSPEDMAESDIATTAIGQSIAVTPLQLVRAMSAIANDGVLLKPHIVKAIRNPDNSIYMETKPEEVRRAIESETAKTVVGLLEEVVATGGGGKAAVKGYRIAGKTGTAQKIREDGAGYMDGRYIASFCGFAPVEDPQFVVLVTIDDPTGIFYGGQIAAPIAGRIFSQLLRYRHIEPTGNISMYDDTTVEIEGEIAVKREGQAEPKPLSEPPVEIPAGKTLVPDFKGLSIREASRKAASNGLAIESEGSGLARSQSIEPNAIVDEGSVVKVQFSP
ncbi:MAG TPA: peptidoglycan glycosyltransferase [Selenomonas sp.]|nr:PASTA domain-containing protein [Selenomonadaceae bacterium]HCB93121.1 peptidoglycan glycosyltransferase [Selenomonas sp.]